MLHCSSGNPQKWNNKQRWLFVYDNDIYSQFSKDYCHTVRYHTPLYKNLERNSKFPTWKNIKFFCTGVLTFCCNLPHNWLIFPPFIVIMGVQHRFGICLWYTLWYTTLVYIFRYAIDFWHLRSVKLALIYRSPSPLHMLNIFRSTFKIVSFFPVLNNDILHNEWLFEIMHGVM